MDVPRLTFIKIGEFDLAVLLEDAEVAFLL